MYYYVLFCKYHTSTNIIYGLVRMDAKFQSGLKMSIFNPRFGVSICNPELKGL